MITKQMLFSALMVGSVGSCQLFSNEISFNDYLVIEKTRTRYFKSPQTATQLLVEQRNLPVGTARRSCCIRQYLSEDRFTALCKTIDMNLALNHQQQ